MSLAVPAIFGHRDSQVSMSENSEYPRVRGIIVEAMQKHHVYKTMDSPVGRLTLVATDEGLAAILWENERPNRVRLNIEAEAPAHPVLLQAERQLSEYFDGKRTAFNLDLDVSGTPFQRAVWNALLGIPFGETRTYGQIAAQIGKPGAVRAVGAANGRNPLSIVAPCHRVVGAAGKLIGFAGGLPTKARLLAHEKGAAASDISHRTRMHIL